MHLSFHGAARTVTGSKHLISLKKGLRILLDCGMFQGLGEKGHLMNRHFGFDPSTVDILVLSHAHIDHSGLIPALVRDGFKGPIYCTPATLDLCEIMLLDSAHIQASDIHYTNRRRIREGLAPFKPLYTVEDVKACLGQFVPLPYETNREIDEDVTLRFTDAGHIIGSAVVNLSVREDYYEKKIAFTGDIGRLHPNIIREPQPFPQCNILITESTYGDRLHQAEEETAEKFLKIVIETCVLKKGKLIIPAFSVGRTQEIVYALDRLENQKRLPRVKVFVDSPLSTNATDIMRKHSDCFNDKIKEYMLHDADPFGFGRLQYIRDVEDSKKLNQLKEPCIIISASGMAEAGRVKHHLANNIGNPDNTILIVGHCEPESLGGRLASGVKEVRIFGETYHVNAHVEEISSLSAHGDQAEMLQFIACQDIKAIKKTFVVHGEYPTQLNFKKKLEETGHRHVEIPELGAQFDL
jgi:metallo-beta-lactamase family protein